MFLTVQLVTLYMIMVAAIFTYFLDEDSNA